MYADPLTSRRLSRRYRAAWLMLLLGVYGWALVFVAGAILGNPPRNERLMTAVRWISAPSLLWWVWMPWALLIAAFARHERRTIRQGEWRRVRCRLELAPGWAKRHLLIEVAPDHWRRIDSMHTFRARTRHLEGCSSLDVAHGDDNWVVYRVPECLALRGGRVEVDLAHDASRAAIEELVEQAGLALPQQRGDGTPRSEPMIVFHSDEAGRRIFALNGREIGRIDDTWARAVEILDGSGQVVVRVHRLSARACVVTDGTGSELARVERSFWRGSVARITLGGVTIATLRGTPSSLKIVIEPYRDVAQLVTPCPGHHIVSMAPDLVEPLRSIAAAAPIVGRVLAEAS